MVAGGKNPGQIVLDIFLVAGQLVERLIPVENLPVLDVLRQSAPLAICGHAANAFRLQELWMILLCQILKTTLFYCIMLLCVVQQEKRIFSPFPLKNPKESIPMDIFFLITYDGKETALMLMDWISLFVYTVLGIRLEEDVSSFHHILLQLSFLHLYQWSVLPVTI